MIPNLLGYFQRTIVRYTQFGHITDIGLYPVLRTCPPYPASNLPALYPFGYGAYRYAYLCVCIQTGHPALLPPAPYCNPLALFIRLWRTTTLRLRQPGSGLCPMFVSLYRTSPFSSRAKPGTQPPHQLRLAIALRSIAGRLCGA